MIVKDEVATINITLGSMRDHIDEWTIVDTGSTDGTQARHHARDLDATAPTRSQAAAMHRLACIQNPVIPYVAFMPDSSILRYDKTFALSSSLARAMALCCYPWIVEALSDI